MIISPHPQNSPEWLQARAGIITASQMDNLVSPTGEIRKGKMPDTYLNLKLAEWWTGGPLDVFKSFDMDQGQVIEEEAIAHFAFKEDVEVQRVGLITTDDGFVGASPDGLIEGVGGLEVKAPLTQTHVGYLRSGKVPSEYILQVQTGLYVTGLPQWTFVSYRRGLPSLIVKVEPDESLQAAIREAVEMFRVKLNEAKNLLMDLNGGPPKRIAKPAPKPAFVNDPNDFTP